MKERLLDLDRTVPGNDDSRDWEQLDKRYVRFGSITVDLRLKEVYREGRRIQLQCKSYQALIALLHKPDEIVTRQDLSQTLWPNYDSDRKHINIEVNVNTTVNKLRRALGDTFFKPIYIQTIRGKGYVFISDLEYSDSPFPVSSKLLAESARSWGVVSHFPQIDKTFLWAFLGTAISMVFGMALGAELFKLRLLVQAPRNAGLILLASGILAGLGALSTAFAIRQALRLSLAKSMPPE